MEQKDLTIIIDLINEKLSKLKLSENLKNSDLEKFYLKVIPVLKKFDYEIDFESFYAFISELNISNIEAINIIKENPQVLIKKGFYEFMRKYIFLSVVENETNTQRLRHIKKTPKDFKTGLEVLFSKYFYMKELGIDINWSTLVRQKKEKLDKKVETSGIKPLTIENIKNKYPIDDKYIDKLKAMAINNFGVLDDKRTRNK